MPTTDAYSDRAVEASLLCPALFSRRILRHKLWDRQIQILRAIRRPRARVSVKACHASSKTFTAAEAAIWFGVRYEDAKVITTAPVWTQVERLMWGEIRKAAEGGLIRFPDFKRAELPFDDDNYLIGISTNEGVRFQGWHGRILIVVDEAMGLRPDIFEAMEGVRAGGDVRFLLLANPTSIGGYFYETQTSLSHEWETFTIDGLDSPNVRMLGDTPDERVEEILRIYEEQGKDAAFFQEDPRPYLITRSYIREKHSEWGPSDPRYQSRVRGQFPDGGTNVVYPLSALESLFSEDERQYRDYPDKIVVGVDVAGPGEDATTAYARQKDVGIRSGRWEREDARGDVLLFLRNLGGPRNVERVQVDSNAIGHYFHLAIRDAGYNVVGVNVSENAIDRDRFPSLRDEVYWTLRERMLDGRARGHMSRRAKSQLAAVHWTPSNDGRIKVESKDEMKARGLDSPDDGEAVILAYASPPGSGGPADWVGGTRR